MTTDNKALLTAVLQWWKDHECDAYPDGDGDERNAYDEPPEFVQVAHTLSTQQPEAFDCKQMLPIWIGGVAITPEIIEEACAKFISAKHVDTQQPEAGEAVAWQARMPGGEWFSAAHRGIDAYRENGYEIRALYAAPKAETQEAISCDAIPKHDWELLYAEPSEYDSSLMHGWKQCRKCKTKIHFTGDIPVKPDAALSAQRGDSDAR